MYGKRQRKFIAIAHVPYISFLCMCWRVSFKKLRAKRLEENCNYPKSDLDGDI